MTNWDTGSKRLAQIRARLGASDDATECTVCGDALEFVNTQAAEIAELRKSGADECRSWQKARIRELEAELAEAKRAHEWMKTECERVISERDALRADLAQEQKNVDSLRLMLKDSVARNETLSADLERVRAWCAKAEPFFDSMDECPFHDRPWIECQKAGDCVLATSPARTIERNDG